MVVAAVTGGRGRGQGGEEGTHFRIVDNRLLGGGGKCKPYVTSRFGRVLHQDFNLLRLMLGGFFVAIRYVRRAPQ